MHLSDLDIFGIQSWLFDETALLEDHLMNLELCYVIDRAHPVIDLGLTLVLNRAINSVVVARTAPAVVLSHIGIVELLIQNASKRKTWVKLDPGRSQHEVNMPLELITPELDHPSQVELADHLMRLNQGVHVSLEAVLRINRLLVKLDLDEAVRIRSNDEVDLRPVNHDHLLDVVHNVG